MAAAGQGVLENPRNGSFYSGIGVISGWKCNANGPLTVRFNDGDAIPLAYHNERGDTAGVCGDTNNGFVAIMNWANLGDGSHTAVVYDNGVEFARSTFAVATTGEPYVTGAEGECRVPDFPAPGETMSFAWNEATQHLEMSGPRRLDDVVQDDHSNNYAFATPLEIGRGAFGRLPRDSEDIRWFKHTVRPPAAYRLVIAGGGFINDVYASELDGNEWTSTAEAVYVVHIAVWERPLKILIGVRRDHGLGAYGEGFTVLLEDMRIEDPDRYNALRFFTGDPECRIYGGWVWPPRQHDPRRDHRSTPGGQCYTDRDACAAACPASRNSGSYCVDRTDLDQIVFPDPSAPVDILYGSPELFEGARKYMKDCGPQGPGPGTIDCENAWTGSQGDFQVISHCLAACGAAQAGDIQGRDANCSILRTYERHYPGTVLRYCPVCQ